MTIYTRSINRIPLLFNMGKEIKNNNEVLEGRTTKMKEFVVLIFHSRKHEDIEHLIKGLPTSNSFVGIISVTRYGMDKTIKFIKENIENAKVKGLSETEKEEK